MQSRNLLLAALSLIALATGCRRAAPDDFQVVVTSVENRHDGTTAHLQMNAPSFTQPITVTWDTPMGTYQGGAIDVPVTGDFTLMANVVTADGDVFQVPGAVPLRAILAAGSTPDIAVQDYRATFMGTYQSAYQHYHYDDLNGTSLVTSSAGTVTLAPSAQGPLTNVDLTISPPGYTYTIALYANGDSYWAMLSNLHFAANGDSVYVEDIVGGNFSNERYYHQGLR